MTQSQRHAVVEERGGELSRFVSGVERLLKSPLLLTICFALAARNILGSMGLGFWTWLPVVLVYNALSIKIEEIHARASEPRP
jgi:hypothetical protein